MEWDEISDPAGMFIFDQSAWALVRGEYLPEEIQAKINSVGVQAMVRDVNDHFQKVKQLGRPLLLSNKDGQASVIGRYEAN